MADDVPLPIAAPTIVATDDIGGGRQAQLIKLLDGRGGSALPASVGPTGALDTGQPFLSIADIVADASQPSYTTGQLFGSIITLATAPAGYYLIDQVLLVDVSGAALPALDLVVYGDSDTPPITGTSDGDALTSSGFSAVGGVALKVAAADLVTGLHPFFPNAAVYRPATAVPWRLVNGDHPLNATVAIKVGLVTTGIVASPTGGPFAIAMLARHVGATSLV